MSNCFKIKINCQQSTVNSLFSILILRGSDFVSLKDSNRPLKEFICFSDNLMLVDNGFSFRRAHEIEAAILAAAALAADSRNDVSLPAHANRIARHLLDDSDEIGFHPAPHIRAFILPTRIFRLRSNEALYGIGKTIVSPRLKISQSILFTITLLPSFSWGGSPPSGTE